MNKENRRRQRAAKPSHFAAPEQTDAVESGLLVEERRRRILSLLSIHDRVTVDELSRRFDTSQVTIRGDLKVLADTGTVVRSRGGALLAQGDADELSIETKESMHRAEKARIAEAAVHMISGGQTVILDSGTTTAEIARLIRGMKLHELNIITNSLSVAVAMSKVPFVRLIMPGGMLSPKSHSLSGPQAEAALRTLQADLLFLGVDSLDPAVGLMTPHLLEAQLKAQMIRVATRVVAVADSSKLMRRNLSVIAKVEQVHTLITDSAAPAHVVADLRHRGLEVILV